MYTFYMQCISEDEFKHLKEKQEVGSLDVFPGCRGERWKPSRENLSSAHSIMFSHVYYEHQHYFSWADGTILL